MLDSSLIVAALRASGRTRRNPADGQVRPWAAPERNNRRGASSSQDANMPYPDNTSTEQVLTETTPRK